VRDKVSLGFALVLAVLVGNAVLMYVNVRRLIDNDAWVAHTHEVISGLEALLGTVQEAELGDRGFLLTGKDEDLEPYRKALVRVPQQLDELGRLTADNPAQRASLRDLREHIQAKFAGVAESARERRRPNWTLDAAERARLERRKKEMEAVRQTVATMRHEEELLLRTRAEESAESAHITILALVSAAVLSIALLALAFILVRRSEALERRAAERVRQQREWLEVTLLGIGDGVIATGADGRVLLLNPVAQRLTGWTQAQAFGRPLPEVFHILHEKSRQPATNPVERALREGVIVGLANHTVLIARDGTERPIDDSAGPIRSASGQVVGAVLIFRDITERRRLEAELHERVEALSVADQRKDEFLAMLAHELRNPLAPLRNALQILRLKLHGEPVVEQFGGLMERQVMHLVRLVDDLLDVSRISRGKIELRRQRVDLAAVVARAVESVRPLLEERRHHLEIALPETPAVLEADADRLVQVLLNLLGNAARYTPAGGHITLTAAAEDGAMVLRLRDDGIGIRPEMLPRVFDMFQQADRVPGKSAEGLGLGLTLVKNLVEMHGGTVEAHSEGPGTGSEFVVRLPSSARGAELPLRPEAEAARAGRPVRILVVDDNPDAADSLALLLRGDGHQVEMALNCAQALERARTLRPEVVLLDIALPGGADGYEVARRLREMPEAQGTMLVALTGYGQEQDRRRSAEAGFAAHLVKPIDLELLRELLGRLVAHS
jgi:PAS domain S-box-containing protein